ncbi:MAG: ABC transporter ATP-binding protein [Xanthobacteraceae bacterium]|nr:MAG: ABC transporter ATP-binding protein [Xanthobacteraceae bacterium]
MMLKVQNLEVLYQRSILGVADISIDVPKGHIVAIIGANGAGKSTTLRAISGFIGLDDARVSNGSILFDGRRIENRFPHQIAHLGIALVPERDKVFPNLTVQENLEIVASRTGHAERRHLEASIYDSFPRLAALKAKLAGLLSGGERQMLAIGSAIMCSPTLLLIDELSLGLAPVIVDDIAERLMRIRDELRLTILLVEQSTAIALRMADYAYVFENGRVVLSGSTDELRNDSSIQDAYLGTSGGEQRNYRHVRNRAQGPAK